MNTKEITVSVIGASGYSGIELVRLLSRHPGVRLASLVAHSAAGKRIGEFSLQHKPSAGAHFDSFSPEAVASSDLVFVALPSGEAGAIVAELSSAGKSVIDLGGDLRLKNADEHRTFYGREQGSPDLVNAAVYGLCELNRNAIASSKIVANPGCYATSVILPLVPVLHEGIIEQTNISVASLSGVSGAGKKSSFEYSFSELNDSVQAYKTAGSHQHIPEIRQAVRSFAGKDISFTFVPHLVPITRGIHTTIVAPLSPGATAESVSAVFSDYYAGEPFVALSANTAPALRRVQQTNMIEIGWAIDASANTLAIFSTIDNLGKGAAGQAVQNMNIMCGFDETLGL